MAFGFFSETFSDQGTMDDGTWQFCGLSRLQRLYAFGICIGNVISIFSLTFIIGIYKQVKTMFAPVRFWATVIYLSMLVVTLVVSITLHLFFVSLILVVIQFCALVWYSASYIPYGREVIRRFFGSCVTSI
ncbi:hypothetical protein DM01DRAFT_315563 [Hesseltinella vesiculosa]|uniref:Protein transport protein SFT2 n=1 Tax=Hesseltinella vesiculosa TaxID=101127 RepID=A0A1X2GKJ0_9FUNG|nr:hypothetical protein DM01DRAFT_315563 [Hesseltinella vesiculosa]